MQKDILRLTVLGLLAIAIVGCEVSNPGSPFPNQPPETFLVLAPAAQDTFNHYVDLKWSGTDPDGEIAGFWILIDSDTFKFTQAYEETIAFYAPGDTAVMHTLQVTAVDDQGLADPTPPTRTFYASNTRPTVAFAEASVPDGATIGRGFAVELEGQDLNPSSLLYSIAIDDSIGGWVAWSANSTFLFCNPSLEFLPDQVTIIDGSILSTGAHTIYARIKDAGEALGEHMISVHLTVEDNLRPAMDTLVVGTYGSNDFYADGSVFYRPNRETKLTFSASADSYFGMLNAYSYALTTGEPVFSAWQDKAEIVLSDASPGEYEFHIRARDIAGAISDTVTYSIFIVQVQPSQTILIVDETRDGTGNPGSPNDQQVDDFYNLMVGSRPHDQLDYATHQLGGVSYLSPFDLYNYGLVIYHTDDKANFNLATTRVVLAEYMDRGGKVIFSGWDLLSPFQSDATVDSATYSSTGSASSVFVFTYMRLFSARRSSATSPREFKGMTGMNGYPNLEIDPQKLPASWAGSLDKCWSFDNRGETTTIGSFEAATEGSPFQGTHCAHFYIGTTYSVAVFGFPLYFCHEDQAQPFMDQLLTAMMSQ
jgi:hypothetical protein